MNILLDLISIGLIVTMFVVTSLHYPYLPERVPTPPKRRRAAMPAAPANAALQKELANERKSVSDMLKVIRAFPLPAGSPPAMVFRPMKGTRGRRS